MPVASAYGVTISTQKGLICVGGTTADGSISDVFLLSLQEDVLVTDTLPSLPMTIDNMAGALIGDLLYIVGGNVNGVPSADMYSLDLSNMDKGWQKEPGVPGEPRVQPVCAAQGGKLYVWGGFAPAADGREATLSVDGYVYSPETRVWTSVATPVDKEGKSISLWSSRSLGRRSHFMYWRCQQGYIPESFAGHLFGKRISVTSGGVVSVQ